MSEINLGPDPVVSHGIATDVIAMPCSAHAVCWAAIFAGAAGAAALSLVLVVLGSGLGFSVVSPWKFDGISATSFGVAAIAWLSFTQLAASGVGGYLAGRLRARWLATDADEVYFRDTAHGFLAWAVASLLTALVLSIFAGSIGRGVSDGTRAVGSITQTPSTVATSEGKHGLSDGGESMPYILDTMFRPDTTSPANLAASHGMSRAPAAAVSRIFVQALHSDSLPTEDRTYIGGLIAQRTGISQAQAEMRVSKSYEQVQAMLRQAETTAREAADAARKISAYIALWMSVAMLIGAFVASLMAVYGGRKRDY